MTVNYKKYVKSQRADRLKSAMIYFLAGYAYYVLTKKKHVQYAWCTALSEMRSQYKLGYKIEGELFDVVNVFVKNNGTVKYITGEKDSNGYPVWGTAVLSWGEDERHPVVEVK